MIGKVAMLLARGQHVQESGDIISTLDRQSRVAFVVTGKPLTP